MSTNFHQNYLFLFSHPAESHRADVSCPLLVKSISPSTLHCPVRG